MFVIPKNLHEAILKLENYYKNDYEKANTVEQQLTHLNSYNIIIIRHVIII